MSPTFINDEFLNSDDGCGIRKFLKCDVPIFKEFAYGNIFRGGMSLNISLNGFRTLFSKDKDDRSINKYVCVVTRTPRAQKRFNFYREMLEYDYDNGDLKSLEINHYERVGKDVYTIIFKYK